MQERKVESIQKLKLSTSTGCAREPLGYYDVSHYYVRIEYRRTGYGTKHSVQKEHFVLLIWKNCLTGLVEGFPKMQEVMD